jgi:hypothetical protein
MLIIGCTNFDDYVYEVVAMKASNADNSGELPIDATADSVPAKAYAIKLMFTMEARGGTGDELDEHESGHVNQDRLASINVYALRDFDSTHAAGISLNDYIIASPGGTISQKIQNGNVGSGSYQNTAATSWTSVEYFKMMHQPQMMGNYSFVIDIGMSDGRHLIDTTTVQLY